MFGADITKEKAATIRNIQFTEWVRKINLAHSLFRLVSPLKLAHAMSALRMESARGRAHQILCSGWLTLKIPFLQGAKAVEKFFILDRALGLMWYQRSPFLANSDEVLQPLGHINLRVERSKKKFCLSLNEHGFQHEEHPHKKKMLRKGFKDLLDEMSAGAAGMKSFENWGEIDRAVFLKNPNHGAIFYLKLHGAEGITPGFIITCTEKNGSFKRWADRMTLLCGVPFFFYTDEYSTCGFDVYKEKKLGSGVDPRYGRDTDSDDPEEQERKRTASRKMASRTASVVPGAGLQSSSLPAAVDENNARAMPDENKLIQYEPESLRVQRLETIKENEAMDE